MDDESSINDVYPALHLDNQLCFSLYRLSRLVTQNYAPLLKPLGITYPQYLVLLVLWQNEESQHEAMSVSQLTEALQLDTGTVTPLLKRMESKSLLLRQRNAEDERIVMISLTQQGRLLREQAKSIPQQLLCKVDIGAQKLLSLHADLNAMVQQINVD